MLLEAALAKVGNKARVSRAVWTRATEVKFTLKDYEIPYFSNEFYLALDCCVLSQVEKKVVPNCLLNLISTRHVDPGSKHLVILRNIDRLADTTLGILKSVICNNLENANFICTMRSPRTARRVFATVAGIYHCNFDMQAILNNYIAYLGLGSCDKLTGILPELIRLYGHDCSVLIPTLWHPSPILYRPAIELFIESNMDKLRGLDIVEAWSLVRDLACAMISSHIMIESSYTHILEYFKRNLPSLVIDCIEILSKRQAEMCISNKIVFSLELMFMELHGLMISSSSIQTSSCQKCHMIR